jgi:glycosyltransferase involved in cell wall biosynthesis
MNNQQEEISIIIPVMNNSLMVGKVMEAIRDQTLHPQEILLVDSSNNKDIEIASKKFKLKNIDIRYVKVGSMFPLDRLYIAFCKKFNITIKTLTGRRYPFEATNIGCKQAKYKYLALLDAGTIPDKNWLSDYIKILKEENVDLVFGKTQYQAISYFQKILLYSSFGNLGHETTPGTLIKKNIFLQEKLIEGVRAGGDLEWRQRLKKLSSWSNPTENYLNYYTLPTNIFSAAKKFFIYQLHSSRLEIQEVVRDLYLGVFLILVTLIIPKWNAIVGWSSSPLYIPNITKIYFLSISLFMLSLYLLNKNIFRNSIKKQAFIRMRLVTIFLLIIFFIIANQWNAMIANWIEISSWYIPHITKMYLGSIFSASLIYRGLYFPIRNNVELKQLFPLNWLAVGLLGLFLDLIKAPGYLLGSLRTIFKIPNNNDHK